MKDIVVLTLLLSVLSRLDQDFNLNLELTPTLLNLDRNIEMTILG